MVTTGLICPASELALAIKSNAASSICRCPSGGSIGSIHEGVVTGCFDVIVFAGFIADLNVIYYMTCVYIVRVLCRMDCRIEPELVVPTSLNTARCHCRQR